MLLLSQWRSGTTFVPSHGELLIKYHNVNTRGDSPGMLPSASGRAINTPG